MCGAVQRFLPMPFSIYKRVPHLAGVYHTAYCGLHPAEGLLSKPAFVCWNPRWRGSPDGLPFATGLTNSEFARRLGVDPATTDPDDYLYGREV
jgi:hypothetical protein